ncbi:MAG: signal peptidase I [Bradyrhizobium sp.]|nr:signal peptidase I [Bradyrhizobium sp.]
MAVRSSRRSRSTAGNSSTDKKESVASLLRFVLTVAALAWAFRSFVVQPFYIPSGSMLPSLYVGDYLAVAKWPYGYSQYSFPFGFPSFDGRVLRHLPDRGDVVVFRHPNEHADLIKRVIGLPGDRVAVRGGRLVLNGRVVPRQPLPPAKVLVTPNSPCRIVPPAQPVIVDEAGKPACTYRAYLETLPGGPTYTVLDQVDQGMADEFPETIVPPGRLFLMGDNRDDSADSRFAVYDGGVGMVPTQNLIGRASFTFWSTDGSAFWVKPWTWFTALRARRIGNGYTGKAE